MASRPVGHCLFAFGVRPVAVVRRLVLLWSFADRCRCRRFCTLPFSRPVVGRPVGPRASSGWFAMHRGFSSSWSMPFAAVAVAVISR
jgi:hypothetical protein